jgi:hypothetical protein
MTFKFERPVKDTNEHGALNHADFHAYINRSESCNGLRSTSERQPAIINVNAYFLLRDHENEDAAKAEREKQIHETNTKHGQIRRFSGTPENLTTAEHTIDEIKNDVGKAVQFLHDAEVPYVDLGPIKYRNNVDVQGLRLKAEESLVDAMTKDIETTFSLVHESGNSDLIDAYQRAERRASLAERRKLQEPE